MHPLTLGDNNNITKVLLSSMLTILVLLKCSGLS